MARNYMPEDVLRAHAYAMEILAGYLVITGLIPPDKMTALIRMASDKLESDGHKDAGAYLRDMWANGLNGEWAKGLEEARQRR